MARIFLILFGLFIVLVFVNFTWTLLGNAFASHGGIGSSFPILASPSGSGLSAVDFSIFDKGGDGLSYVTQGYGRTPYSYLYVEHWHNGIDIAARYGAKILSPGEGRVIATGNQDNYCYRLGFGKFVAIEDGANGLVLWYAHLGAINVSLGDAVKKEQLIGTVGTTGFETGPHLHLSIFKEAGFSMQNKYGCGPDANGADINPLSVLGSVYQ